jgi:hypothetical protein
MDGFLLLEKMISQHRNQGAHSIVYQKPEYIAALS